MYCVEERLIFAYDFLSRTAVFRGKGNLQRDKYDIYEYENEYLLGSIHTLGAVLGCLLSIPTMGLLGRRGAALYVMTLAYLLGYLFVGLAVNPQMIIVGKNCLLFRGSQ